MPYKKESYVVIAHITSEDCGFPFAVVYISKSPAVAVDIARTVENLGYNVDWSQGGVCVIQIDNGIVCSKSTMNRLGNGVVIYQRKYDATLDARASNKITEFFYDEDLVRKFKPSPKAVAAEVARP